MIFQFPDIETFRFAVTTAQVPVEVSGAPAEVAFDSAGRPSVKSDQVPSKPMQRALRKLGVKEASAHYSPAVRSVGCWPQVLPVTKQLATPEITSTTPVLFELPAAELPTLVSEMLRLGNDRQSIRSLTPANGHGERALLKVIGPPYYTLLRAIDKSTQKGATVTAFVETAPRVWVEIGYQHPLADKIRPAAGQVLLLRPEHEWQTLEEAPFQDVYEVLDLMLPAAPVAWQQSQLKGKLAVPLRLVPGNAADAAEMWVLTEQAVDQLDTFVRDADERLLARLLFAVAGEGDRTTILIKMRPSKLLPPVVALEKAIGFKPFWKLPNLFLPVGRRLMPTLRRDAVRKLLADDPGQVVWLMPDADGKFRPEVLPDDAFRPLEDWIDYVIDREHEVLQAWMQATQFDFDSFICKDEVGDRPKTPPGEKARKPKRGQDAPAPEQFAKAQNKTTARTPETTDLQIVAVNSPNELKLALRAIEDQFKDMTGSLDAPERLALWPELARLNAALKDPAEAALCWANAFWESSGISANEAWAWLRTEDTSAQQTPTAAEWDQALANKLPSPSHIRALVARVVYACQLSTVPKSLLDRLPTVRDYVEAHESMLGVRAVWLTWWHLTRAAGGPTDVLGLARVRDRLLQRLLAEGLNKERDLPFFLRTTGDQNGERMRQIRERALRVYRLVDEWHVGTDVKVNKPYVDLIFAFGLARLGEETAAHDLMRGATALLDNEWNKDPILQRAHHVLAKAFTWRIENCLQGKPHTVPLPATLTAEIGDVDRGRGNHGVNPKYIVERMIEQSWILEPEAAIHPYASQTASGPLTEISLLTQKSDAASTKAIINAELAKRHSSADLLRILVFASEYVQRAGEDYTLSFIAKIPEHVFTADHQLSTSTYLGATKTITVNTRTERAKLLSRIVFLAAHYGNADTVNRHLDLVFGLLSEKAGQERYDILSLFARRSIRDLRRLGLKSQIDRLLRQISDLVVMGRTLEQLKRDSWDAWPQILSSLLCIAEGWQFFGAYAQARPYLDEARNTLFENARAPRGRKIMQAHVARLAQGYVSAAMQGPQEEGLDRVEELFKNLERLSNTFTTGSHFSRLHLNIVEEVVRSLVSDNITLGDRARRWLDDDEYLVRRRIHGDIKGLLDQNGF